MPTLQQRYNFLIGYFSREMPQAKSELNFSSPFELLCAVMLSAQCTDKRVNMVTPLLFQKWPDAKALAAASVEEIRSVIASISYPNSKAAHLSGMAKMLVDKHEGEVPSSIEELMELPGVGRKTANVVASIIYQEPVIAVDTHVFRVSHRLGLSKGKTPEAVEKDLERHIPREMRATAHHWLILHGRYVCKSRAPLCKECALGSICPYLKATERTEP